MFNFHKTVRKRELLVSEREPSAYVKRVCLPTGGTVYADVLEHRKNGASAMAFISLTNSVQFEYVVGSYCLYARHSGRMYFGEDPHCLYV